MISFATFSQFRLFSNEITKSLDFIPLIRFKSHLFSNLST